MFGSGARMRFARAALVGLAMLAAASVARAEDAALWLSRAATAARQLNYVGTIVYQHGALRRDIAAGSPLRSRRGVRQARQPRRPRARGDPQPRRGTLLLPGREVRARRAADVPQRVPVALAAAAEGARRFLRFPQGRDHARRRPRRAGVGVRAEGRPALRSQVLDRPRNRAHPQGARGRREQRRARAVRFQRSDDRRQDRSADGEADVAGGAGRLEDPADRARSRRKAKRRAGSSPGYRRGS